jgi:hypothetical protein
LAIIRYCTCTFNLPASFPTLANIYVWVHFALSPIYTLVQCLCTRPNYEVGIIKYANPSSRTMALGSTQPLTEMSTRNLPGGIGLPARGADILTAIYETNVWKMWEPRRPTTVWAFTASYRGRLRGYDIFQ